MPDTLYKAPYVDFWIVFTDGVHPLCKFMRRGFSHCYVITRDDYNWIKLNPEQAYFRATILAYDTDTDAPRLERPELSTVLKVSMYRRSSTGIHRWLGVTHCVNTVKYILGIKINALTPYSLYKKLLTLDQSSKDKLAIQSVKLIT